MRTAGRWIERLTGVVLGPLGPVPTGRQLLDEGLRHAGAITLVLLAAQVVRSNGHTDQQWQYVVIAVALVPQPLTMLVAWRRRPDREKLRVSTRPSPLLTLFATVLAASAGVTWLTGGGAPPVVAALCAAAGLALAAAPVTVTFAPRRSRSGASGGERLPVLDRAA